MGKARTKSRPARRVRLRRRFLRRTHRAATGSVSRPPGGARLRKGATQAERLITAFRDRRATIGVIGMGYVGLPLACEFARAGFAVRGIDVDRSKVDGINSGRSHVQDVAADLLRGLVGEGRLRASTDVGALKECDAVVVCVPTPLRKTRDPDISYIVAALDAIVSHMHRGMLVVLESTTYPGTTEEVMLPKLEGAGFKVGRDLFLAFSPERVDPGNPRFNTRNTPKIIGGITPACGRVARALYEQAIERVVPVSNTRAAEMVKLLENTFRSVNIGLVNEIALMCDRLGLNVWEVIEAAATKPFGFMPFFPGPGLGGHCLPIDPLYLSWKLKTLNYSAKFIELASEINGNMPHHVVTLIVEALNERRRSLRGARILILGAAYKRDVGDVRESPALDIMKLLVDKGADVRYNDPHAPAVALDGGGTLRSVGLDARTLKSSDAVVIVTDHSAYNYDFIVAHAPLVVDTRNATRGVRAHRERIRRL